MKKVEIITKRNGKKKSQLIKVKSKKDLVTLLTMINYCLMKDNFHDLDLTGEVKFKIDGEKLSPSKARVVVKNEIENIDSEPDKKKKKDKNDGGRRNEKGLLIDGTGRIIISSRSEITKTIKPADSSKKKKSKKKNKKANDSKKKGSKKVNSKKKKMSSRDKALMERYKNSKKKGKKSEKVKKKGKKK